MVIVKSKEMLTLKYYVNLNEFKTKCNLFHSCSDNGSLSHNIIVIIFSAILKRIN